MYLAVSMASLESCVFEFFASYLPEADFSVRKAEQCSRTVGVNELVGHVHNKLMLYWSGQS